MLHTLNDQYSNKSQVQMVPPPDFCTVQQLNILTFHNSVTLKTEAVCSSEMSHFKHYMVQKPKRRLSSDQQPP
jgi:hypothetical protein